LKRKIGYVAPKEIGLALAELIRTSIAIDAENAVQRTARVLGFPRVTEEVRNSIA
jgi:hypothetical protein